MEEIHKTYLNHMRNNESNVVKFLTTLFSAIAGFFIVVKTYPDNTNWLVIASIGSSIILLWGILYTLSMSYNHRYLQVIMWHYENKLKLPHCKNWNPEKFNDWCCTKSLSWEIAPEPYKMHLIGFCIGITFIWFIFLQVKIQIQWYRDILILIGIFFSEWLLIVVLNCWYISKLKNVVKKGMDNV